MTETAAQQARRAAPYAVATTAAVAASAVAGSRFVDPRSAWYRGLDKPGWQPPPWAFPAVWTPLYASIAWAGARGIARSEPGAARRRLELALAANLAVNTAWNWAFFRRRSIVGGLAATLTLDASNLVLIRGAARADRPAAAALVPYAAWCGFATALNASLARRNKRR